MKKFTDDIRAFLSQKKLALVGYSSNPKKFGFEVYKTLSQQGYTVFPVNPSGGTTSDGDAVYHNVASVPADVEAFIIATKPEITSKIIEELEPRWPQQLWVNQMSGNKQIMENLVAKPGNIIYNRCIFMHANPSGIHKFHRWLAGLFGRLGE